MLSERGPQYEQNKGVAYFHQSLLTKLVDALFKPEDGDEGVVDLAEIVEAGDLLDLHIDLDPGLGAERGAGDLLDVEPEAVLVGVGGEALHPAAVLGLGVEEVGPGEDWGDRVEGGGQKSRSIRFQKSRGIKVQKSEGIKF